MSSSSYRSSLPKTWLWLSSLLPFFIYPSACATIPSGNALVIPLNLTSLHPPLNLTAGEYHCTRSADWTTPEFEESDCGAAINKFLRVEERLHGQSMYEFLTPEAYPDHPSLKSQITPRKYAVGKLNTERPCLLEQSGLAYNDSR